jgi:predicted Zn-dependent protease with MMP-like domain
MNYIYARFSIHGEKILQINEIKSKGIFLSLCSELKLNIWGFFEGKAIVHNKFILGR